MQDEAYLDIIPKIDSGTTPQMVAEGGPIFIGNHETNEKLIKLNILLVVFFYEKRFDAAIKEVALLIDDPEMAEHKAYLTLLQGRICEMKGDFDATLGYYCKAFTIGKWSPYLRYFFWNHIGVCWLIKKKFKTSEWCCRKAVELNPTRGDSWMNLGVSLEYQGKFMEALDCYIKAFFFKIKLGSIVHIHRLIATTQALKYPKFLMLLYWVMISASKLT